MASKKEKADADRIKAAAALSAAKGMSRTQAEKAATAAARNVNAYGQKEEGPSRWQERKEAKRQMYLMSTERAVILGVRKDASKKPGTSFGGGGSQQCQKCFQTGHWTYECKNVRMYVSRLTRTQQLANPKLRPKLMDSSEVFVDPRASQQRNVKAHSNGREEEKKRNERSHVREETKRNEWSGDPSDSGSVESYVEVETSGDNAGKSRSRKTKRNRRSPSSSSTSAEMSKSRESTCTNPNV